MPLMWSASFLCFLLLKLLLSLTLCRFTTAAWPSAALYLTFGNWSDFCRQWKIDQFRFMSNNPRSHRMKRKAFWLCGCGSVSLSWFVNYSTTQTEWIFLLFWLTLFSESKCRSCNMPLRCVCLLRLWCQTVSWSFQFPFKQNVSLSRLTLPDPVIVSFSLVLRWHYKEAVIQIDRHNFTFPFTAVIVRLTSIFSSCLSNDQLYNPQNLFMI